MLLKKELRALAPAWCALSIALLLTASKSGLSWLTLPIYFVGTCTLGALSCGHEYANDTLQWALTLPLRRSRVLLIKQLALGSAMAGFAGVTYLVATRFLSRDWGEPGPLVLVGLVFGLFVAPWLTIALRNPLAGAVFSTLLPGLIALLGKAIGARLHSDTAAADALAAGIMGGGTVALGLGTAAMMWPAFGRLEMLGPRGAELQPRSRPSRGASVAASAPPGNRIWLLIKKELHLHQLAAALAIVYALAAVWIGLALRDDWKFIVSLGTTEFYSAFVAVLAGAFVTAEERRLGTLDWQASLPLRGSTMWLIKIGTAVSVALALGVLWPLLIHQIATPLIPLPHQVVRPYVVGALGVVVIAVYVSSLCRTALEAAVITVPSMIGFYALMWYFALPAELSIIQALHIRTNFSNNDVTTWLLFIVFGGLGLRFAYLNHRASDRPAGMIVAQIAALAVADVVVFAVSPIVSIWM